MIVSRLKQWWPGVRRRAVSPAPQQKSSHYARMEHGGAAAHSYFHQPGQPVWMPREFNKFADEGYVRNVIASRCIHMIANGAASVDWRLYQRTEEGGRLAVNHHPLLTLLRKPNPCQGGAELFETIYAYRLISGNSYIHALGAKGEIPKELHVLRPDRVSVIAGRSCVPAGYRYKVGDYATDYLVDRITGQSAILHLKAFHPLNDWYGLSPIEAAAYAIDQHNQAGAWNQALLQNGARPSGALIVRQAHDGSGGILSEEQYQRLKEQLESTYQGAMNAGRPLLLEGGLEWREMSLSPKDMDFIETKNTAARDIALAFGVPPQMLGIPGDNKYSNFAEARLSLWEQTILPLIDQTVDALNNWLIPMFGDAQLELGYDTDSISALAPRRESTWQRISKADFLSEQEKRELLGVG